MARSFCLAGSGSVLDPHRPLAVIEVETQDAVQRVLDDDPTVRSGVAFRYETLPMMVALRGVAA